MVALWIHVKCTCELSISVFSYLWSTTVWKLARKFQKSILPFKLCTVLSRTVDVHTVHLSIPIQSGCEPGYTLCSHSVYHLPLGSLGDRLAFQTHCAIKPFLFYLVAAVKQKCIKWHRGHKAQKERLTLAHRTRRERCGMEWKLLLYAARTGSLCGGELLCKRHKRGCQIFRSKNFYYSAIANCQQRKDTCTSKIAHFVWFSD